TISSLTGFCVRYCCIVILAFSLGFWELDPTVGKNVTYGHEMEDKQCKWVRRQRQMRYFCTTLLTSKVTEDGSSSVTNAGMPSYPSVFASSKAALVSRKRVNSFSAGTEPVMSTNS